MLMKYRKEISYLKNYRQNLKKVILYVSKNQKYLDPQLLVKPYMHLHKLGLQYKKAAKNLRGVITDLEPYGYVDNYTNWDIFDSLNSIDGLSYQYHEIQGDADEDIPVSVNMVSLQLSCDNNVSFEVKNNQLNVLFSDDFDDNFEKCTDHKEIIGNFLGVLKTLDIVIGYRIHAIKSKDKREQSHQTKNNNNKEHIENGEYSWDKIFN